MGRSALRLAAAFLLLLGGFAVAVLPARPAFGLGAATSTTTAPGGLTTLPTVTSPAKAVVVLTGHGWGHGLGLSQWGAYGYAKQGWSAERILAHYYPGTTLGPAKPRPLRVLIASAESVTLSSALPWSVTDGTGRRVKLLPGSLVLNATPELAARRALRPPFTFVAVQPISIDGTPYRGTIAVSGNGKLAQVIDTVGIEQYLDGVVPAEMPSDWAPEALKAQAVAARSYALANLAKGQPFDLYGDSRSQVYGGVGVESPATTAAVDATRGQVVLYSGKVADTLFFSTSGGRTASALEATGVAVPYLVSVSDPYDTLSPYHDWGPVVLDAAKVAKVLKVPAPITDLQATAWPSGRARSVTVVSADGTQLALTGNEARTALGLPSTWFSSAFLALAPAARTITYGGAVSLTGVAHGAPAVALESKTAALPAWAPADALSLEPDGSFSTNDRPQTTTQYRLAWGNVRAGLAKIAVAPRIEAGVSPGAIAGSLRPALPGAAVQLQLQAGAVWTTVSSTTSGAAGSWNFSGPLAVGTYRIRCAPGRGLAAAVSATLLVQ